jgi:hypothetical protein
MDFIGYIASEWQMIGQAPVTFVTSVIVIGLLVYAFVRHLFDQRLASRDGIIDLKNAEIDDYKRKLGGASPDEARQKIEALERRLQALEPRSLTPDQIGKMGGILAKYPAAVQIVKDMGSPESARIHTQVEKVFRQMGWQITSAAAMGVAKTDHGILITTRTGDQITEKAQCVMDAFSAVGLAFDRRREPVAQPNPMGSPVFPDLEILFTDFSPHP